MGFTDGCELYLSANAGDMGSVPVGSGRSPGGGHGNPLQYSCLENPIDRGAWWATVHGVEKSRTQLCKQTTSCDAKIPVLVIVLFITIDQRIYLILAHKHHKC